MIGSSGCQLIASHHTEGPGGRCNHDTRGCQLHPAIEGSDCYLSGTSNWISRILISPESLS